MSDIASLSQQIRDLGATLGGRLDGVGGEVRTMGKDVGLMAIAIARVEERDKASRADIEALDKALAKETSDRLAGEALSRSEREKLAIPLWKTIGGLILAGVLVPAIVTVVMRTFLH